MVDNTVTMVSGVCDELLLRTEVAFLREEFMASAVEETWSWVSLKWKVVGATQ